MVCFIDIGHQVESLSTGGVLHRSNLVHIVTSFFFDNNSCYDTTTQKYYLLFEFYEMEMFGPSCIQKNLQKIFTISHKKINLNSAKGSYQIHFLTFYMEKVQVPHTWASLK